MATYAAYRHVELYRVGFGKKRVLKPPGGGCSISFGGDDEPMRPTKSANPSATAPQDNSQSNGTVQNGNSHTNGQTPTTNGTCNGTTSNGSMTPNGSCTTASSPGSAKSADTQNRLFGSHGSSNGTPKVRDHMRSSIFGDNSNPSSRNGTPNGTVHSSKTLPKVLPAKASPEGPKSSQEFPKPETTLAQPEPPKADPKQINPPVTAAKAEPAPTKVPEESSPKVVDVPKPEIRISENVDSQNKGTPSGGETTAKATPEPPKPASAPAAQPAQPKTRVPPGGFSTALW